MLVLHDKRLHAEKCFMREGDKGHEKHGQFLPTRRIVLFQQLLHTNIL